MNIENPKHKEGMMAVKRVILISACLLGCKCRYDGTGKRHQSLIERLSDVDCVPVCPEELGGLPTPRPRAEIQGGDGQDVLNGHAQVVSERGQDVTEPFIRGAQRTLEIARTSGATEAILKSRSPSCGCHHIASGKFDGTLHEGKGVTAAFLERHGIRVQSEREIG